MSKLTKEEFTTLVDLLEKIAPRPAFIKATNTIITAADIVNAIKKMKENVKPKVDRIINPWTYAVLKSAGMWDDE